MFGQNVLIIKESDQETDDFLNSQLLNIGYRPLQLFIFSHSSYKKNAGDEYEVILIISKNIALHYPLFQKLNTDFPDIPLIVITDSIPDEPVLPTGVDDWLLKSWVLPQLLKKTIQQVIMRKKNVYNDMRIFHENPNAMYIYEKDTFRFLEANTAALDQYGYSLTELLQITAKDIRPRTELKAFYKINEDLPPIYSNAGIWQHIRKNGEIFYVHIYVQDILFAGKSCKMVMAIDIDGNVKAETALKKKAREIENILESITDSFFTVNKDWKVTYINKEFEKVIKRTRTELLGKDLWEAFPDVKHIFFPPYHKAMEENISVHFEVFDPSISRWLFIKAYPTDAGLAVYFIDITDQKNYQQKIEMQNRQFKEIAWVQAHQIRGPVSNLLALVDLFNIEPNDPDNLELLARVKHTAIQMDESIQEIVQMTMKIES